MKKLIAVWVVVVLLFNYLMVGAIETDTDDTEINKAVNVLAALNILTDYNEREFKVNTLITRGECIAVLTRILVNDDVAKSTDSGAFSDVPDDWRSNYIEFAVQLGLINGNENGEFDIEGAITFNQAIKMLVSVLGYSQIAQQSGGYPNGYIIQATKLGLLDYVSTRGENLLTRGDFAYLVYNSLDVDIREQVAFTAGNPKYSIVSGKNLLTEKLNVIKAEGKVYANYITSLVDSVKDNTDEASVRIEKELFKTGDTTADKYLGYQVEYYAMVKHNIKTLLYVTPATNVREITVNAEDIIKSETTKDTLVFGNSSKKLKISENADVLYNGKPEPLYTANDLSPDSGTVKLIDNNNDGKYDTVIIESYETYLADAVLASTNRISFMFPNGKPTSALTGIPTDDQNVIIEVFHSAGIMKYTSINRYNVLSIAQSKNTDGKKYVKILVSQTQEDAMLSEISSAGERASFVVNDNEYLLNKMYSSILIDSAVLGKMYTYYFDAFGKIAFIDKSVLASDDGSIKYGYVVNTDQPDISGTFEIKLFDSSGEMKVFKTAVKISFSREGETPRVRPAKEVLALLTNNDGKAIQQLVQYDTNIEGKINEIKTAMAINDNLDLVDPNKFTVGNNNLKSLRLLDMHFGLKYFIGTNTVVMIIPPSEQSGDDKAYAIGEKLLSAQNYYNVRAYDLDQVGAAGLILVQAEANAKPGSMDNLYIVERITTSCDDDGSERKKIYLNTNGSKVNYIVSEECLDTPEEVAAFNKIQPGDAIQIVTSSRGEIASFEMKFDVSEWTAYSQDGMGNYYSVSGGVVMVGSGTITKAEGNFVRLNLDLHESEIPNFIEANGTTQVTGYFISLTRYYHVKKNGDEITVKTIRRTDLTDGMKMMFFRYYHSFREIIIYEGF